MSNASIKILACAVVVEELRPKLASEVVCETLDFGLHRTPEVLKAALQEAIDASVEYDTIVLAYGLCGMAMIGLHSNSSTLIVPMVDDCISIFLGSREAYLEEQRSHPGSLFLTKGWLEGEIDDGSLSLQGYYRMVEKYGEEGARRIQSIVFRHYKRLAFIITGEANLDKYREQARQRAAHLNLRYEEIPGSTVLVDKIANNHWRDDFVIAPPGRPIDFRDFFPQDNLKIWTDKDFPPPGWRV